MKNITVSVTDLQFRRIHIWAAQRGCTASFIVRRFLEDLPKAARALQALNAYELNSMGIPATPENKALVDFLRPVPRNKKVSADSSRKANKSETTRERSVGCKIEAHR